ncbi:thioredoxin [Granulicatella sp. zg-ZJ]|uniref:thioredoxin family protein n=1 Tax=Granulicatella sp. zg-ZJ TaxID=2678504 RepID=UPI0013D5A3AD|nr:thioredoxin family protein [Granulicatella sp. zg-ZJ]NEW62130.1 thioredoxin [Granulicatella sp. zg-ZJ]
MKKTFIPYYISIFFVLISLSLIFNLFRQHDKATTLLHEKQEMIDKKEMERQHIQEKYSDVYYTLNSLLPSTFEEKMANQDTFYVYIGRPTCADCQFFEPFFIKEIQRRQLHSSIFYVNVLPVHQDKEKWTVFKQTYHISGTPVVAKVEKGIITDKLDFEEMQGITPKQLSDWLDKQSFQP